MEASRKKSSSTTFSINSILQEEKRSKMNEELTSMTYIHDFGGITAQNHKRLAEPVQNTAPQNCVTTGESSQTSFLAHGFIPNEGPNTGLNTAQFGIYTYIHLYTGPPRLRYLRSSGSSDTNYGSLL
jgi:hypothetical protein